MRRHFLPLLLALVLCLLTSSIARAHFIWLVRDNDSSPATVSMYFSEDMKPGALRFIQKLRETRFTARAPQGSVLPRFSLSGRVVEIGDEGRLVADLPSGAEGCVEAWITYGVHKEMLVNYYAKALLLSGKNSRDTDTMSKKPSAEALDIVAKQNGSQVKLAVYWRGKPAAECGVQVFYPNGETENLATNPRGGVKLDLTQEGKYGFLVSKIENEKSGEHEGKKYSRVGHFCTLTLDSAGAGAKVAAERTERTKSRKKSAEPGAEKISASELLANARKARDVWGDDFPGFTADVVVTVGSESVKGTVEVSADGDLDLRLPEGKQAKWANATLGSLVGHRMPTGDLGDKASYLDEDRKNPLGRLIKLDSDSMGSVYRVRNNVVRQVNRDAGPSRFTITVLEVQRNKKGLYLPTVFNVASWNRKTGELEFSLVSQHTYQRVGEFDLPKRLVEVNTAQKNKYEVKEVKLSHLKLSLGATAARAVDRETSTK